MTWRDRVDPLAVGLGVAFGAIAVALLWWLGPLAGRAFPLIVGWLIVYILLVRLIKGWRETADGDGRDDNR